MQLNKNLTTAGFVAINSGIIKNCLVSGEVNNMPDEWTGAQMTYMAMVVGFNRGQIYNTVARGTVNSCFAAAGFIGYNQGIIENSYSEVNVNCNAVSGCGDALAAGFAIYNNGGTIENCYASGTVYAEANYKGYPGNANASGFLAIHTAQGQSYNGIIRNCFTTSNVTAKSVTEFGAWEGNATVDAFCYGYIPGEGMQTVYNSCSCDEQEIIEIEDGNTYIRGGSTYSDEYREVYFSNLTNKSYLINTMNFKEFISIIDVGENTNNVWVISSANASLPKLYWEN